MSLKESTQLLKNPLKTIFKSSRLGHFLTRRFTPQGHGKNTTKRQKNSSDYKATRRGIDKFNRKVSNKKPGTNIKSVRLPPYQPYPPPQASDKPYVPSSPLSPSSASSYYSTSESCAGSTAFDKMKKPQVPSDGIVSFLNVITGHTTKRSKSSVQSSKRRKLGK